MKNIKGGFISYLAIVVLAILVAGGAYYFSDKDVNTAEEPEEHEAIMKGDTMMKEGTEMEASDSMIDDAMKTDESSMIKDGAMMEGDTMMTSEKLSFEGTLLAGSSEKAPLLDFNKKDYDKAIASGKLVALYFYANWCPICKAEFPKMEQAFNSLNTNGVVGFRVNYNDNETDKDEENLAREFGVAYQHTKVFVREDTRVLKSPEGWNMSRYTDEINKFISQ